MYGGDFLKRVSPLQYLISHAVDAIGVEPDYAKHLEVAELINEKKANTPREAAMTIVRRVNGRDPQISLQALALLDTLVQQCGYAFHLQISTKEFLNELVRRFPEHPPPFPGPVMTKILELIHTWKETICTESRWKDDLGNIRDMHRLLTFKGYRFRDFPRREANVASTSNLKTADELEEEDREAQSAKLQELIRRGTPRDLAAAQELMKQLAGADPEKKPDYRAQSLTELNKLEQKVILLNEMLDNVDTQRGERFVSGDVYDQVSGILEAARPKIQKWISDAETGDPEMLDIFLQMNDQLNSVLNRYEAFKKGDYSAAANPVPAELASTSRTQESSLIDFDDAPPAPSTSSNATDDLADIFGPSQPAAQAISFPALNQQQPQPLQMHHPSPAMHTFNGNTNANTLADIFGSSSPPLPLGQAAQNGPIMLPGTPQPGQRSQHPASPQPAQNLPQGSFWATQGITPAPSQVQNRTPVPSLSPQQQQQQRQPQTSSTAAQGKDPFADLAGLF